MLKKRFILFLFLTGTTVFSETNILDTYIKIGLENNLALKQKEFSFQKSMAALGEARGLFLPSISFEARYSRAGGGRLIKIPIGDLMNPLYHTLNDLLEIIGQPAAFPTDLQNEYVPFLREREHETKIRLVQPVFQPAVFYNYKIKRNLKEVEKASKNIFTRQLVSDIKTAYFNYLKTIQIHELLEKTELLLRENIRVNEKLLENQKVTKAAVFRARAELYELEQAQAEAEKNRMLAGSYFNFLLNRPLDSDIEILTAENFELQALQDLEEAESRALQSRDELFQLENVVAISEGQIGLSKSSFLPNVTFVADYGFQGEKYRFTDEDDYWIASMIMHWNLFKGFQDKNRIQQAKLEKRQRETQLSELKKQICLQVREAYHNVIVARKTISAAGERRRSAQQTFRIIDRRYREGMVSQIEFIDARTTMTEAEINGIVADYDYFIRRAELERVIASYVITDG